MRRDLNYGRLMSTDQVKVRFGIEPERCPFDGGEAFMYLGPRPHMTCIRCGADGPISDRSSHHDIELAQYQCLKAWNIRTINVVS